MYLPTGAYFALTPLLYGYVKSLTDGGTPRDLRAHFIPVALEVTALAIVFTLPAAAFERFFHSSVRMYFGVVYTYGYTGLALIYSIASLRLLYRHPFASGDRRRRLALNLMSAYLIANLLAVIVQFVVIYPLWRSIGQLCDSVLALLIVYWAGIAGQRQLALENAAVAEARPAPAVKKMVPKARTPVQAATDAALFKRTTDYLERGGYRNRDLTLKKISDELDVPQKELSRVINACADVNFKTLVARFRVAAAQQKLRGMMADRLSYEGIAQEVGFRSKSSFYRQFKDIVGETPGAYRERVAD